MSRTGAYRLAEDHRAGRSHSPSTRSSTAAAPSYDYPVDLHKCAGPGGLPGSSGLSLASYLSFADYRMKHGQAVVGLKPGALDQIKLGQAAAFPGFHIRNIASSGIIWTGARMKRTITSPGMR